MHHLPVHSMDPIEIFISHNLIISGRISANQSAMPRDGHIRCIGTKLFSSIQIKTHALLPQTQVTLADFGNPVYRSFVFLVPNFKLFGFPIF